MGLVNFTGVAGPVGYLPPSLFPSMPMQLLKVDDDGVPVLDAHGKYVLCALGETGELIGRDDKLLPGQRFQGYSDAAASAKKVSACIRTAVHR